MILQQYYTRERRGIFRTTEGYDTVAKSQSLDNNLIKKAFHSYCFYDPPRELQIAGEKDGERYPEALTFMPINPKESMLGQSVYVPVDFTGQRSTFFSHNYLIPETIKEDFIKHPEKILYANEFRKEYDIEQGVNLPELKSLSYTHQIFNEAFISDLFEKLGMTEVIFKSLLSAIAISVTSRKKVYIALDVDAGEISKYAKKLLLCILESLPYEIRRALGFISYLQKPESKKNINIMFVDKESIRHGVSGTEKDFIFDFSTNQFTNMETSNNPYLDFVWNNRGNQEVNTSFYEFIDQVLNEANRQQPMEISNYNHLAIIYQIINGNKEIYNTLKDHVLEYILFYVGKDNINKQVALNDLATGLIREELETVSTNGSTITPKFTQHLIPYYEIAGGEGKDDISKLVLFSLLNAKRLNQEEYVEIIFEMIQKNSELIKKIISQIVGDVAIKEQLLNDYLKLRLGKILKLNQWIKEVERLREIAPGIIMDSYFQVASIEKLVSILKREHNIVFLGQIVHKDLKKFTKGSTAESKANDMKYIEGVKIQLDQVVLGSISLETITEEDLRNLKVSEANNSSQVKKLYALQEFVEVGNERSRKDIKNILRRTSHVEKQELQSAIKNLIMKLEGVPFYEGLLLAFYNGETHGNEAYDYNQLLEFIYMKKGKEKVYAFILWSAKRKEFTDSKGNRFNQGYEIAIKNYFLTLDREAFKDSQVKKRFYNIEKPGMKRLFKQINYQLASGFEKIIIRYGRQALKVTGVVMLGGMLVAGLALGAMKVTEIVIEKNEIRKQANKVHELEIDQDTDPSITTEGGIHWGELQEERLQEQRLQYRDRILERE